MRKPYPGITSRFIEYTSSGDPVAKLILVVGIGIFVATVLLASLVVVIPIGAVVALIVFLWRRHKRQKLKVIPAAPRVETARATAPEADAPEYFEPVEFARRIDRELLQDGEGPTGQYSCKPLSDAFTAITAALYAQESFHAPPLQPATNDPIAIGKYRDQIETWRRKVSDLASLNVFGNVIINAYLGLRQRLPSFALSYHPEPQSSPFTVPLRLSLASSDLDTVASPFFAKEAVDLHLFDAVRARLLDNVTTIRETKAEDTFERRFENTPFADFAGTKVPLVIPDEARFAGTWVIAPQGMGKTTLLHDMIIEDIPKNASIILMDSKGDLIEPFLKMRAIEQRRVIIGPDNPTGINPLDIPHTDINKAVDNLEYLFSSLLDFKLTAAQSMLLKAVLRSLVTAFPKPTLATFQDIMSDGPKKYAEYISKLEPDLQNFFKNEFFSENIKARRQEVLQRLRLLLDHDLLRSMLMASSTTFRLGDAMDQGAFIIINNSRGRLGNKGAEFFGRFFIAQVLAAAQQRSFRKDRDKKPVYFYIDECYTVIAQDERVTDILHECRSQKIALILAHQETSQVSDKVLNALQNCAVRLAHPDEEAKKLSATMRMDAKALQSMHRGQFAAYVRGLSKESFVMNVSRPDFSSVKDPSNPPSRKPTIHGSSPSDEPIVNFNPRPAEMEPWRLDSADKPNGDDPSLREAVKTRFASAPKFIQDLVLSEKTDKYLRSLADAQKLDADQFTSFENEVMLAFLGFQPADKLSDNLQAQVPLPADVARRLGKELARFIEHTWAQAKTPPESAAGASVATEPQADEGRKPNTASPQEGSAPGGPEDPGEPADNW